MKHNIVKILFFFLTFANLASTEDVGAWVFYENNPVIKVNDSINKIIWNDPSVIKEGGMYRMWLSGGTGSDLNLVRIYEAKSFDGIEWSINSKPIIEPGAPGEWDDSKSETPCVIKVNDAYHLYYSGFKRGDGPGKYKIGHATSKDGVNWQKDPNNPVISFHDDPNVWGFYQAAEPGVVYNPRDKKIYLYYVTMKLRDNYKGKNQALATIQGICLATSFDGSNFEHYGLSRDGKRDAVLVQNSFYSTDQDYRGYSTPFPLIDSSGVFYLFHDVVLDSKKGGWQQVSLAYSKSDNGYDFLPVENDFLVRGEESWTTKDLRAPSVLEDELGFTIWYAGNISNWRKMSGIGIGWYSKDNQKIY